MFERGWYLFGALFLQLTIALTITHNVWWLILGLGVIVIVLRNQKYSVLVLLVVMGVLGWIMGQKPHVAQPQTHVITVYPDQVTNRNNWLYGQGQINGSQKVNVGINSNFQVKYPKIIVLRGDFVWQKIKPATNPGEFDFQKYEQTQKIYYQATAKHVQIQLRSPQGIVEWLHVWRCRLLLQVHHLPHWLRLNASSLLLGQFDNQEQDLQQGLTNLGIIHIFSISGLHIYLLVNWISQLAGACKLRKEYVDWLILVSLPAIVVLTGSGIGVWRACISQILKMLNEKYRWYLSRNDIFAGTLIIHSFLMPQVLWTLAGQLSYLLAYGLIVLQQRTVWQQALLMNLLSLPILIFHNYSFSWLTFLANLCLTPLFEKMIIPLTLISVFLMQANWLINPLESLFTVIYAPIQSLAHASWSQVTVGKINLVVFLLLLFITLIIAQHPTKTVLFGLLIGYCGIILVNRCPMTGEVSLIDVGQGDSILITTPFLKRTYLIDTGGKLNFGHYHSTNNRVQSITIPYLRYRSITHLDGVFLSHQDADHIGDLNVLLQNFPVKHIYLADGMQRIPAVVRQLQPFIHKITIVKLHVHDQILLPHQDFMQVVWPPHLSNGKNEDSLSLIVSLQGKKWLFTGDLDRTHELQLFKHNAPQIDFLKAGHHGSKTASSKRFLQQIKPKLVLISVGRHNRYGHPSPETLRTLKKLHIPNLSTAKHGMITWNYNYDHQQQWRVFSRKELDESQ